jgi:curved DNA-binding protein CbpA
VTRDPFAALGLAASPDLTNDDVRAAWRRVAAATHPDRADGGDPGQFAVAASAYSDLRTRFGRNEALADLRTTARRPRPAGRWAPRARLGSGPVRAGRRVPGAGWAGRARARRGIPGAGLAGRIRRGRPGRLALRLAAAVAVSVLVVMIAGWQPATPALIVGALTWLIRTARQDLGSV